MERPQNSVRATKESRYMSSAHVLVIGAAGKLGRRLVQAGLRQGHSVTALVRDGDAFARKLNGNMPDDLRVIEGDILDDGSLDKALEGQRVVISAAGNVNDGTQFSELFEMTVKAVERSSQIEKAWFLAGAAILDSALSSRGMDSVCTADCALIGSEVEATGVDRDIRGCCSRHHVEH
jgi:hypothetical protein